MKKTDFTIRNTSLNGNIYSVSALTNNAQKNNKFEIHTHYDKFEIYYFIKGDLYFAFEGNRINIEEGSMVIIANGMLHRPIIKNPCLYFRKRILFSRDIFTEFNSSNTELYKMLQKTEIIVLEKQTVDKMKFDILFNEIEDFISQRTKYCDFCAMISIFSLLIKANNCVNAYNENKMELHNDKVLVIMRYIDDNLKEGLTYKNLAKQFSMSEKSLYKFFKKETGFALGNYINERRIIKSQSILNSGKSAKEAAIETGFKDYTVFYRSFLKKTGITPLQYIKNLKDI